MFRSNSILAISCMVEDCALRTNNLFVRSWTNWTTFANWVILAVKSCVQLVVHFTTDCTICKAVISISVLDLSNSAILKLQVVRTNVRLEDLS